MFYFVCVLLGKGIIPLLLSSWTVNSLANCKLTIHENIVKTDLLICHRDQTRSIDFSAAMNSSIMIPQIPVHVVKQKAGIRPSFTYYILYVLKLNDLPAINDTIFNQSKIGIIAE